MPSRFSSVIAGAFLLFGAACLGYGIVLALVAGFHQSTGCRSSGTSNSRADKCAGGDTEMTDRNSTGTNGIRFRLSSNSRHWRQLTAQRQLKGSLRP
jgi:hypothetical protein